MRGHVAMVRVHRGTESQEYVMKHVKRITIPAKALALEHPSVVDSIKGLIADPVGTIQLHLKKDV